MKNKILQSSFALMIAITVSKLVGMFRDIVLANCFGTSNVSDAYLISISVPTLIFYYIGHSLSTAYLPMYNKIKSQSGEKASLDYSNNLLSVSLVICAVLVLVLMLFPTPIIRLFAPGFDAETLSLTTSFVKSCAASLFFMTSLSILGGFLQASGNYLLPAIVSLPRNAVLIISIIMAASYKVEILGIGILLAYVAEFLLLVPSSLKTGYRFYWKFDVQSDEMKETLFVILPIILGVGVGQINKIIDRSIASTIISGGISALTYGSVLNNAVQEVLVTGIITVLFARCASWVAEGKHEIVKEKLSETLQALSFLLIPASLGIIAMPELIVKFVLARGSFDDSSVAMTSGALCCYTVGLVFSAHRDTMVKVFYAYKETKITMLVSVGAIVVNIVLNIVLSQIWGINGLAIATSISAVLHCIALYVILRKKIEDFGLKNQAASLIGIVLSSLVMFLSVKGTIYMMINSGTGEFAQLIVGVCIGCFSYAVCVIIFKVPIARKWIRALVKR